MSDRRNHNRGQVAAFLDDAYPSSVPGSPDPDLAPDDNKKGSRVVIKAGAWERVDSALGGRRPDKHGRMTVNVGREINRSYRLLQALFDAIPLELDDADAAEAEKAARNKPRPEARRVARFDAHLLATRFVLLNTQTAGGHEELERLRGLGRAGHEDARAVARLCGRVIKGVLDELDRRGYWLGWGTDGEEAERQKAARDRRKRGGVLATAEGQTGHEAIAAYRDLMLKTGSTVEEAEDRTMEHFGCSRSKVQKADRDRRGVA